MAPPKTMAISQQQQQTTGRSSNQVDHASKSSKKRSKGSQKQQQSQGNQQQQVSKLTSEKQQVNLDKPLITSVTTASNNNQNKNKDDLSTNSPLKTTLLPEQPNNNPKQVPLTKGLSNSNSNNQVPLVRSANSTANSKESLPLPVKTASDTTNIDLTTTTTTTAAAVATPRRAPVSLVSSTFIAKQLSTDEPDDIDAGIELDGSSNSGSSVKDLSEDQTKSTSVSPVMAQASLLNEDCNKTKHAIQKAPMEQLASSMCTEVSPTSKKLTSTTTTAKQQQLAANLQVIDADEQLLQQKLLKKDKQRKSSVSGGTNNSTPLANVNSSSRNQTSSSSSTPSNGGPATPQSPAVCKICEQHVYQMERLMAEKGVYHKSCFRCSQCKIQLRIDNYSSHEGRLYCKAHHRQIFQPQVKLDSEDDVDIVAKSNSKVVDDYLLHRGRLSDFSFSFLQPKPEGIRKRQMIICENEPAELPKDVVRSNTKVDDGIDRLNLNLNNILEKFERGQAGNGDDDAESADQTTPSSAGAKFIDKPSFSIKKTLMAFETKTLTNDDDDDDDNDGKTAPQVEKSERPIVRKLSSNLNSFLNRQNSGGEAPPAPIKPLAVRRSESLMMRLKKYESRIAGEQVVDDSDDENGDDVNNNKNSNSKSNANSTQVVSATKVPTKLSSIDLSSLKSQWESGDISTRRRFEDNDNDLTTGNGNNTYEIGAGGAGGAANKSSTGDNCNGNSPLAEKNEELIRVRQQLARKKSSGSASVRNIYENAIKEAQLQQTQAASRLHTSDLSALSGLSTTEIQNQLLQQQQQQNGCSQQNNNTNNHHLNNKSTTPTTPTTNKDHFQILNLNKNKANKLKERFELGLINNSLSYDDDDDDNNQTISNGANGDDMNELRPSMTKLEQIRQEKLEDLSIFTEGEIKAREARSMFQQIDRRLSAANGKTNCHLLAPNSRSLASINASMQNKLKAQMNSSDSSRLASSQNDTSTTRTSESVDAVDVKVETKQGPIRLINNVRT